MVIPVWSDFSVKQAIFDVFYNVNPNLLLIPPIGGGTILKDVSNMGAVAKLCDIVGYAVINFILLYCIWYV